MPPLPEAPKDDEELRERYRELLEELRTVLPGAQVLFGFLLMVPFNRRFTELDDTGRALFMVALVGTATAILVFLTPAALHRVLPRESRRLRVTTGARISMVGMALLAGSMAAAMVLLVRFIFEADLLGWTLGAAIGVAASLLWWGLPAALRANGRP